MKLSWRKSLVLGCCIATATCCGGEKLANQVEREVKNFSARPFPKIFLPDGWKNRLEKNRKTEQGRLLENYIFFHAAEMLQKEPVKRKVIGFRMLDVAREVLFRINVLSFAYLLSGEQEYAEKALQEMRNIARYDDWNIQHFLDPSEITLGLAIGYDLLYGVMTPQDRELIEKAIVEKALKPSFLPAGPGVYNFWIQSTNNWNQVCHASLMAGALVVSRREPELAQRVILRALENLPRSLQASYSPSGAYAEGPGYWVYGTEFTCIALALLQNSFRNTFGLDQTPGLATTAEYVLAMVTPRGEAFSYADSMKGRELSFASFYLADYFNRPEFLNFSDRKMLAELSQKNSRLLKRANRLLPLALLYVSDRPFSPSAPLTYYSGDGSRVPVCSYRTGFDRDAMWLGIKAGPANAAHGHQDCGSFVLVADGEVWADDLGPEHYNKIESLGMQLWSLDQGSDRWKVFRLGPRSHNVLMVDEAEMKIPGKAVISSFSDRRAVVDLSELYDAKEVIRIFDWIPNERRVVISDRLTGLRPGAKVRWQMATRANIALDGKSALLSIGKRSMRMRLLTDLPLAWQVTPCDELKKSYDSPNRNMKMLEFTATAPESGALAFQVEFAFPEKAAAQK